MPQFFAGVPVTPRIASGLLPTSTPTVTTPSADPAGTASTASRGRSVGLLPILDGNYGPDGRFAVMDVPVRPDGGKYPRGTIGIVIPGTKETAQENLFFPVLGAASLVAVNHAGDPSMGSTVADLLPDGTIDPLRLARLQSAWWVIKGKDGGPNSLAWQLGKSGRGDVYGGLVIDSPSGTALMGAKVIACMSVNQGGPLDVGGMDDKHRLFTDADGHPINRGHISTGALYRMNRDFDGPLAFEPRTAPQTICGPNNVPVHLGYDPDIQGWRWWAESAFAIITPPPDEPPWIEDPPHDPDDPHTPEKPPYITTGDPSEEPPLLPGHPPLFPDVPGGMSGGGFGDAGVITGGGGSGPRDGEREVGGIIGGLGQDGQPSHPEQPGRGPSDPPQAHAGTHMEVSAPSLLAQPAPTTGPDIRSNPTPTPAELSSYYLGAPMTAHMEAFGRTTPLGDWIHTTKPGESRHMGGTANGGWVVLSPEADVKRQQPSANGMSQSTTLFGVGPGVSFFAGPVSGETGGLSRGYSWTEDGSGGLDWTSVSGGTTRTPIQFAPTTGTIAVNVGDAAAEAFVADVNPTAFVPGGAHTASPSMRFTSRSVEGAFVGVWHQTDWRAYVEPTDFVGGSDFTISKQIDGGGYTPQFSVVDAAGVILYTNAGAKAYLRNTGVTANRTLDIPDADGTIALAGAAPALHAASHENGGGDEISVAGLSGLLADGQTPLAHAASHQNGGSDEISVAGLSGLLADAQTPAAHAIDGAAHTLAGGVAGTLLTATGAATFGWTTATYPATTTANQILYSSGANSVTGLATAASSILVTSAGGIPSLATDIPTAVTIGGAYVYRVGGADVSLADGGTNASLVASDGGIVYSTATAMAVLAGTATAGQLLRSGAGAAPTWSTATFPATTAQGDLLYGSAANVWSTLAAGTNGYVLQMGATVPAWFNLFGTANTWTATQTISANSGASYLGTLAVSGGGVQHGVTFLDTNAGYANPFSVSNVGGYTTGGPINADFVGGIYPRVATTGGLVIIGTGSTSSGLSLVGSIGTESTSYAPLNWNGGTNSAGSGAAISAANLLMGVYNNNTIHIASTGAGSFIAGPQSALATNATDGFMYVRTCAGTPTGVPTAYTGHVPMLFDVTNSILYAYIGGAWKQPKVAGVAAAFA